MTDTFPTLPRLADLRLVTLPVMGDLGGDWLAVMEDSRVGMAIRRVFTVHADQPTHRGEHAHRRCNQVLVCQIGRIEVICDDGTDKSVTVLDTPGKGLFIPAGIWAAQDYDAESLLTVLCDQPYDESDYFRNYEDFLAYRAQGKGE
ncbi:hypothetical protein A6A04_12060 [Paramagnetospirillum marisnigri]|uniref:Sugar 3,4-ketoisomerase QdtA cupin domain-containing protein n=1 Tax=Paramagnetospirillum marisnigri TaxID=1285242 RepID=A0A178MY19_9PROT|nr:FdtA/QdtA family cupin domain-containing protein [Paramagnetospirillum marisnigri]OAN54652.1 hypothetical protein A6A04_12060 [Paramagnetospirillum marisnigri]